VQASWLGYFATTGLAEIDYLIADEHGVVDGEEEFYTEQIWRLPETRLCFTPPKENVAVAPLPATDVGFITFGCFNKLTKMTDAVVELWARILLAVPQSSLLLKATMLKSDSQKQLVIERFAVHGISGDRLQLQGPSPRAEYLAAYSQIDIALDPFPFTGGTTSVEALWMGVPVLTLRGDRFLSRQGVGILHNVGLHDWIADSKEDYVSKAISHSRDVVALARLRSALRQRLSDSPLCDALRFASHLETALRSMWRQRCAGK
jgi:predicted O-linked N-acetylglucosamine transferase (SPINDLY family)